MSEINYGSRPIHTPERMFLFGDVHNEADKLMQVLDQVTPQVGPNDHIVFCGDLIDRGRDAALTIDALVALAKNYPNQVFFVEGNHDLMLRDYLTRGSTMWLQYLQPTLDDFKTKWSLPDTQPNTIAAALMARDYKEVTSRTVPYYESTEVIATHAPLDYTVVAMNGGDHYKEDFEDRANNPGFRFLLDRMIHELKWQFSDENTQIPWVDKFRVCGHQAGRGKHPRLFKDRAFIDTGCGLRPNGVLTCLIYPDKKYIQSDE